MSTESAAPLPSGDEAARSIAGYVQALRQMAAAEAEGRREVEREVEASRERERRLEKAIAALEGTSLGGRPKGRPKAAPSWRVSEKVTIEVEAALRALAGNGVEAATAVEVAEAAGRSREATRRALDQLRQQDTVRLAGKRRTTGHGVPSTLYALMPDAG